MAPVSYTHLDVYKRQGISIGIDSEQIIRIGLGGVTVQVKVRMVRHSDNSGTVCFGTVTNVDGIVILSLIHI